MQFLERIWTHPHWETSELLTGVTEASSGNDKAEGQETAAFEQGEEDTDEEDTDDESEGDIEGQSNEEGDEDDDDEAAKDNQEGENRVEIDTQQRSINDLLELLFGLSLALCTERPSGNQPSSMILVYFAGILGFSTSLNTFLPARSFTPYLSGLIYVQRLLFLEQALPLRSYPALGIQRRPATRHLDRLEPIRK